MRDSHGIWVHWDVYAAFPLQLGLKALDTTCGMFALKVGPLGSIATLLYELFAGFSDLEYTMSEDTIYAGLTWHLGSLGCIRGFPLTTGPQDQCG
jgi:hypothetical protein